MLSDQDGHGRLFANGTRVVLKSLGLRELDERYFRRAYVTVLVTILPITLYLVVGLLKLAGGIEAAHIPIVTTLTLYLNRRALPAPLRPSWPTFIVTAAWSTAWRRMTHSHRCSPASRSGVGRHGSPLSWPRDATPATHGARDLPRA